MNDIRSLSHSKWRYKYHIVFVPKYCRQVIYKNWNTNIGRILRELCDSKDVNMVKAKCCLNPMHILVKIAPHLSIASFMGYLKTKSSLMIFDRHANLKYKYGNHHFWYRGYFMDTVGRYETAIKEYIKNQLEDDIMNDQISLKKFTDPFAGEPVK